MPAQAKELKQNKSKIPKSIFTLLVIIFAGMLFARVILFNLLATSGQRLAAANQQIETLKEENQKIENDISNRTSMKKIEGFAKRRGFVKVNNVEVLTPSTPIANR